MCMTSTSSVVGGSDVIGRRVGRDGLGVRTGGRVVTRGRCISRLGAGAGPEPGQGDATGVSCMPSATHILTF